MTAVVLVPSRPPNTHYLFKSLQPCEVGVLVCDLQMKKMSLEKPNVLSRSRAGLDPSFQVQYPFWYPATTPDVKMLLTAAEVQFKARLLSTVHSVSLLISDEYWLVSHAEVHLQALRG